MAAPAEPQRDVTVPAAWLNICHAHPIATHWLLRRRRHPAGARASGQSAGLHRRQRQGPGRSLRSGGGWETCMHGRTRPALGRRGSCKGGGQAATGSGTQASPTAPAALAVPPVPPVLTRACPLRSALPLLYPGSCLDFRAVYTSSPGSSRPWTHTCPTGNGSPRGLLSCCAAGLLKGTKDSGFRTLPPVFGPAQWRRRRPGGGTRSATMSPGPPRGRG